MGKLITSDDVVAILKSKQGERPARALADELGISEGHLSDIFNGRRVPSKKIVVQLGLRKTVAYVRPGESARRTG